MKSVEKLPRNSAKTDKYVGIWLLTGVIMIVIQTVLGGVTRLTNSGLSITEWNPIHGSLPPLDREQWTEEFEGYRNRASGQFRAQNADMRLEDFKAIYWWEWSHREWARLLGLVFLAGFIFFAVKGYFHRRMILPFVALFLLGGLQGAIGWIMVQSGLNPGDTHVDHIRLTAHFLAALILLLSYTLWFALKLLVPEGQRVTAPRLHAFTLVLLLLLTLQLAWGGFMAGLHVGDSAQIDSRNPIRQQDGTAGLHSGETRAATAAPTWPTINGKWFPTKLDRYRGQEYRGAAQLTNNPIGIHLVHRSLAYLLFAGIVAWFAAAGRTLRGAAPGSLLARARIWPLLLVCLQLLLGIVTVLQSTRIVPRCFGVFEFLAESHQFVAMCLLIALVVNLYALRRRGTGL